MKFILLPCFLVAPVLAFGHRRENQAHPLFSQWEAPGPDDVRAPCPMLNSLANHGFLPHTGKNLTADNVKDALFEALNINKNLSQTLFDIAVKTNPTANATTFSLDHLSRHNILEHDASLSRTDAYFGNPQAFNATVFNETRSYWTDQLITVQMAANARSARIQTSKATNPTYRMSQVGDIFSLGESAAYILVLGDRVSGTVPRSWIEYLFENERLPVELGWSKVKQPILQPDLEALMDRVTNATLVPNTAAHARRGGFHAPS